MGQLEKYGLYVLCLVIFLILGVALWGGGDVPPQVGRGDSSSQNAALRGEAAGELIGAPTAGVGGIHAATVSALIGLNGDDGPAKTPRVGANAADPSVGGASVGGPQPKVAPAPPGARPTHTVVSGDYLEGIAKRLGSASLVAELRRLNPSVDPKVMPIGTVLQLPTADEVQALLGKTSKVAGDANNASVVTGGSRKYIIVKGDTLGGIARRELGSVRRVDEIYALNPGVDSTSLKIGRSLVLPSK